MPAQLTANCMWYKRRRPTESSGGARACCAVPHGKTMRRTRRFEAPCSLAVRLKGWNAAAGAESLTFSQPHLLLVPSP
jgi:hypothetical protein